MNNNLQKYYGIIDRHVLINVLGSYSNFNDKVSRMMSKGEIIQLKRGKYITKEFLESGAISEFQTANLLYGPSYVSFFTALSYHGLIPEKVVTIESATTIKSKKIQNRIGRFEYQKMPISTFHVGINHYQIGQVSYLIASPTKSLLDILLNEPLRNIYGVKSLLYYFIHDLRIEEESLIDLDIKQIEECFFLGKRKKLIHLFKELIMDIKGSYD